MRVGILVGILSIYMAAAFVGGWMDGVFLETNAEAAAEGVSQSAVTVTPETNAPNVLVAWVSGGWNFITKVASILSLNLTIFQGSFGTMIRAVLLTLVGAPILIMLVLGRFGK